MSLKETVMKMLAPNYLESSRFADSLSSNGFGVWRTGLALSKRVFIIEQGNIVRECLSTEVFGAGQAVGKFSFAGEVLFIETADVVYAVTLLSKAFNPVLIACEYHHGRDARLINRNILGLIPVEAQSPLAIKPDIHNNSLR